MSGIDLRVLCTAKSRDGDWDLAGENRLPHHAARYPKDRMTPFWRGLFHYESAKAVPWLALRNAIGITLPLAIGVAVGHPASGLIGTTGALNVAFSDGTDPYRHRLRRMMAASLGCALAVV